MESGGLASLRAETILASETYLSQEVAAAR